MCPATSTDMLSPPLSILDSTLYHLGCDDSGPLPTQSRAGTAPDDGHQVELRRYIDSPGSSPSLTSHSTSTASSSSYLSPLSSSYLPTPNAAFSPFSGLSPEVLDGKWSENDVRIHESPEPYECSLPTSSSALSDASAVAMRCVVYPCHSPIHLPRFTPPRPQPRQPLTHPSTAALPFDSSFPMSGKQSYAWPNMMANPDDHANLLGHHLALGGGSDAGYASTAGSRSINGSPPRQPLSVEQRELKRQMDHVRRESKSAARFRRSNSNPYLEDATTSALGMPAYTAAAAPISLLAEPATSVPGQGYLSAYSQPLQEPSSAGLPGVSMYGAAMPQQSM